MTLEISKITNSTANIETNEYGLRYLTPEKFTIKNNDSEANFKTKKNEFPQIIDIAKIKILANILNTSADILLETDFRQDQPSNGMSEFKTRR